MKFIARGFPRTFTEADISELLAHFGIRDIKFSKRRGKITAILTVRNPAIADTVLARLHQLRIGAARLSVEHYDRQTEGDDALPDVVPNVRETAQELSNYVRALHVVHPEDFNQPPPPYLRYRYPKATRDIIDRISLTLESVPKFYVQVLHLMNRMNLPPPFTVKDLGPREDPRKDAAIQTDLTMIEESLLAEGESELESDEEPTPTKAPSKGKIMLNKNRFKPYIKPVVTPSLTKLKPTPTAELFEQPKPKPTPAITIHIPEQLPTPISTVIPQEPPSTQQQQPPTSITEQTLLANRVPPDQLANLPVFKNYAPGEPSDKLYIKNLAKSVTEADLAAIYAPFTDPGRATVAVRLMQAGRMKGQAFVSFSYAYPEDLDRLAERPIERARRLTNGFILRDKPMVVCYGKQEKA
uniref:Putative rna-binding protein 40 n=1 Tax=Culex tarsalis TaxID=7177 RepID=A0A1Q3EZV6_CULTA